ncbi:hypothetical protein MN608_10841 [Microdochium nivale]|nr:hypothetical protein MN608_10841 [Microdochium nivale]
MGVPYSKEIEDVLSQVTPLVKEGFQVLKQTKVIARKIDLALGKATPLVDEGFQVVNQAKIIARKIDLALGKATPLVDEGFQVLRQAKVIARKIDLALGKATPLVDEGFQVLGQAKATGKEIDLALAQVTPLVATAQHVLGQTKYVAAALLLLQILSTLFVGLILVCLLALLVTLNPDLEAERRALVTPAVRRVAGPAAGVAQKLCRWWRWIATAVALLVVGVLVGWPAAMVLGFVVWVKSQDLVPAAGGGVDGEKSQGPVEKGVRAGGRGGEEQVRVRMDDEGT